MEMTWETIKAARDMLLKKTDWTQLIDVSISEGDKKLWAEYRQKLRDIPKDFRTPNEVVWPTSPEFNINE